MARQLDHPDLRNVSMARLLSALGDPAWLRIMTVLADGAEHPRGVSHGFWKACCTRALLRKHKETEQ